MSQAVNVCDLGNVDQSIESSKLSPKLGTLILRDARRGPPFLGCNDCIVLLRYSAILLNILPHVDE